MISLTKQEKKQERMHKTRTIFEATDKIRKLEYPICTYIEQKESSVLPWEAEIEAVENADLAIADLIPLREEIERLQAQTDGLKADIAYLDDSLQEQGEKLERSEEERDALAWKLAEYEERFGPIQPTGPKPTTVEEILQRPRDSRFAGLRICFTGDLRPYRKGLMRKAASEIIEKMGGKAWTDKKYKKGAFIVVGKDRTIIAGKIGVIPAFRRGIPAIDRLVKIRFAVARFAGRRYNTQT